MNFKKYIGSLKLKTSPAFPLGVFLFFLIFPTEYNNYSLVILAFWFFSTKQYMGIKRLLERKLLFIPMLYYILVLIGSIYSINSESAISNLSVTLPFLIFPVFFGIFRINQNDLRILYISFISGVVLYSMILLAQASQNVFVNNSFFYVDSDHPTWKYYYFQYVRLSPYLSPIYMSMYTTIASIGVLSISSIENKGIWLTRATYLFLAIVTLLLSSRIGLLSFIASSLAYFILIKPLTKTRIIGLILGTATFLSFLTINSGFGTRISKVIPFFTENWENVSQINNSSGKRAQIYTISSKLIENNYLFGTGTASSSVAIDRYYDKFFKEKFPFYAKGMNCHNQYIESIISWGIIGLLLTFSLLCFNIVQLFKNENWFGVSILICFAITMLAESILVRQKGVFLFMIFSVILNAYEYSKIEDKKTL